MSRTLTSAARTAGTAGPAAAPTTWPGSSPPAAPPATPKVVALTHANLLAAVDGTVAVRPLRGDEVYLFPFPLCHVAGYNVLLFHRHGRPGRAGRAVRPRGVPGPGPPARRHHRVAGADDDRPAPRPPGLATAPASGDDVGTLRAITYGSAPIGPDLLRRATERLGVDLLQGYGMTEMAGNGVFLSADEHRRGLAGDERLLRGRRAGRRRASTCASSTTARSRSAARR